MLRSASLLINVRGCRAKEQRGRVPEHADAVEQTMGVFTLHVLAPGRPQRLTEMAILRITVPGRQGSFYYVKKWACVSWEVSCENPKLRLDGAGVADNVA